MPRSYDDEAMDRDLLRYIGYRTRRVVRRRLLLEAEEQLLADAIQQRQRAQADRSEDLQLQIQAYVRRYREQMSLIERAAEKHIFIGVPVLISDPRYNTRTGKVVGFT